MIRCARQCGYILLPVIMVIALVAAIALLMTTQSSIESNTAGSELEAQRAIYVAEAGMNHALWQSRQQGCGPYGDLVDVPLGNDKYNSALTTDLGGISTFTIAAHQDTWIRDDQPTNNYAADQRLHIRSQAGVIERPLLSFDLTAITAKAVILSATAWFYVNKAHPQGPVDIHRVSTGWAEASATWGSMGANIDSVVLATIPAQPTLGVWVPANLTTQVQAWVNGQSNFGITLNSIGEGNHGEYSSRESANAPYLEVIVGTPPTSPAVLTAVATLANGVTRDLTRTDVMLTQYPASVAQWQHNAVTGVDAYIWEFWPTTSYGADDEAWVSRSSNNDALSLFKFDVDSLLPGTRIYNATLSLLHQSGNNSNVPVSAHRIVNPWNEANVTWQERHSGISWDTDGGDLDARVVSTTPVGPASNIRYQWDLTSLVQGWADNAYPNYGVALRTLQNGSFGERFYSSDETDATRHPRLTITYGCACGEVCVTPQGSGNLLLVVNNPITLNAADAAKKALFESWGYTVSVIDESANQATYDTAIAISDVVFISETVLTGLVGTRLVNAAIGVVSQDGAYNSDLGFSSGSAWTVGSAINVTDTDHYITAPFATGTVEIYANGMEQLTVNGTESVDLQTLADSAGAGSLVLLDTGDNLEGGGTAVGRRVMLPLGRESDFNWAQLNNNGRLLVQRALGWGAGADLFTAPPLEILLMVGDSTTLASKDNGLKLLMEIWGYVVTLIDDDDSKAAIDAAAAAVDVVYVSGTTADATLAGKLGGSPTPIVNEVSGQLDNFGFSSAAGSVNESVFVDTNPAHYISEPFSGGAVPVFTTNLVMPVPGGTLAPELQTVGQTAGSIPALVTLDAGAERWDSNPAAARRVHLPFANAAGSQLSASGETLVQRAIEWAAGMDSDAGLAAPIAHWKLDETSGSSALDSAGSNDGTLTNDPVWIAGLIEGGLDFDGDNDYVDAGVFDVFGTGITMTGWFNAEVISTDNARIISKADGTTAGDAWWQLGTVDSGPNRFLRMRIKAGGTTTTMADSSVNLSTGQWYFAAATYDNTSGEMKLYLDGAEVASGAHAVGGLLDTDAAVPVAIGANGTAERFFNGILDDVRVYDRVLAASEISALYDANAPLGPVSYTELNQPWSGTSDNIWETVDLGVYGVPADAVVEIALVNTKSDKKRNIGVRETGSSLNRRFRLHEAESGGVEVMTMHVQADSVSQIEYYTENKNEVTFVLLGYWVGASYAELYAPFNAVVSNAWGTESLSDEGVLPDQITEIAMINSSSSAERLAGIRTAGSSLVRSIELHEAEGGGIDTVTLMVETDSFTRVQVYAESNTDIDFYVLGYWRTPPGVYTEFDGGGGSPTLAASWQVGDLSGFGVPPGAVAQFVPGNENDSTENSMGTRATGSTQDRFINLHEAEAGGSDLVTMHVNVDASSQVEWYSAAGASNVFFYLAGWWVVSP